MSEIEKSLNRVTPRDDGEVVMDRWQSSMDLDADPKPTGKPIWLFACAAIALAVLGWGLWSGQKIEPTDSTAPTLVSIDNNQFYTFQTQPAANRALIAGLDDFKPEYLHTGDSFGNSQLVNVGDKDITLRTGDHTSTISVQEINTSAAKALTKETQGYQKHFAADVLTQQQLTRISAIARFGQLDALHLLETISDTPGKLQTQAQDILRTVGDTSVVQQLIDHIRDGDKKTRRNALRVLGKCDSPLATSFLESLATGADSSMAANAVAMLSSRHPANALRSLRAIVDDPSTNNEIRHSATDALESFLKEMNSESK